MTRRAVATKRTGRVTTEDIARAVWPLIIDACSDGDARDGFPRSFDDCDPDAKALFCEMIDNAARHIGIEVIP